MTTGFFSAIAPYALKANLSIMVNQLADGKLNVIFQINPKDPKAAPELAKILSFKGTPEELDTGLVNGLPEVAASYLSLAETLDSIRTIQEKQKTDAATKAAASKPTKTATTLPSSKSADANDEDNSDDQDGATVPAAPVVSKVAEATVNLFDQ